MWQKKAQNINAVFVEFFYAQKRLKISFSRCTLSIKPCDYITKIFY
jgi:hypothetical protein